MMGAMLGSAAVVVLGFLLLTGVVVALGASSTADYEFERNRARERQRSDGQGDGTHPSGSRHAGRPAGATGAQPLPHAVGLAVRPAPAPASDEAGWWLVDESAHALAGPFVDRIAADWAAWSDGLAAVAVHGTPRADGGVARQPSPEEMAWYAELGEHLDRLPEDWGAVLSDTDPLTTLVVEVAAVLVEAGLPLHDSLRGHPAGGVSLMPEAECRGVVVSWRAHDRMSLHHVRGAATDATVRRSMNAAVADILSDLGFVVEPFGQAGSLLVTALR